MFDLKVTKLLLVAAALVLSGFTACDCPESDWYANEVGYPAAQAWAAENKLQVRGYHAKTALLRRSTTVSGVEFASCEARVMVDFEDQFGLRHVVVCEGGTGLCEPAPDGVSPRGTPEEAEAALTEPWTSRGVRE